MKTDKYFSMSILEAYEWYVSGGMCVICNGDNGCFELTEETED